MSITMEPVDINSKELQELKSEFGDLKETLDKQRIVNKGLLEHIQKQKASFIGKDLTKRMSVDIFTIPMIIVICNAIGWPILFAVAVSLWALIDLIAVLWMRKKFDMQKMLEDDVLTVAKTIKEYKKFYQLSTVIGAIPAVAMTVYIIIRFNTQRPQGGDLLYVLAFLAFTCLAAVLLTIKRYKKVVADCDNLIDSLESK